MINYHDLFNLDHKVAIVTGAAGILGAELSRALCSMNAFVWCLDLQEEALKQLVNSINCAYSEDRANFLICDVANPESVNDVVDKIIHAHNSLDILINNAATKTANLVEFFAPFSNYSLNSWNEVMSVNLTGMFLMAQAVGKHMCDARCGSIIQTASIYGLLAPDQRIYAGSEYLGMEINTPAVYTASKAGVIGLTKHLAALWGQYNIRVNTLCPGGVFSGQNESFTQNYSKRVPLGRMATTADIIGPMLFLASDASQYITGQTLSADGGLSVW